MICQNQLTSLKEKCFRMENDQLIFDQEYVKSHLAEMEATYKSVIVSCDYSCFRDLDDHIGSWILEHQKDIVYYKTSFRPAGEEKITFKVPDVVRDIIDKHIDHYVADGQFICIPAISEHILPVMLQKSEIYTFDELITQLANDLGDLPLELTVEKYDLTSGSTKTEETTIGMDEVVEKFENDVLVSDELAKITEAERNAHNITLAIQISELTGADRRSVLAKIKDGQFTDLKTSIRDAINEIGAEDSGYITNELWRRHEDLLNTIDQMAQAQDEAAYIEEMHQMLSSAMTEEYEVEV